MDLRGFENSIENSRPKCATLVREMKESYEDAGRSFLARGAHYSYPLSSLTCGIVPQMACEYYVLSGTTASELSSVLRSQAGLWEGKVTIWSWKIPDEYWKFSGFTRFRLPGIRRDAPNLRRLFSARRILRMPTPRHRDNTAGIRHIRRAMSLSMSCGSHSGSKILPWT